MIAQIVDALRAEGVDYMLAGSFASNLHGVPRMTQDADLVIDAAGPAALRFARRLEPDFYVSEEAVRGAIRSRGMFNAIHLDTGFKVDLIVRKARPFSVQEISRRQRGSLAGRDVDFATAEDTILAKLEWAKLGDSERQYGDAVGIIRIQSERLDWTYLDRWAAELDVAELLARARGGQPFRG